MPAYTPNLLISDCYGSAGSITFYHRDGKCRWRRRSSLSFAGTPAQCAALSVHRRALAAWRTISDTEKERWHDIAKNVQPRRPPFGSGGHISGHNLFVSAYHGFVTLGDEHIPQPVEYHPFPVSMVEIVSASVTNSSDLRILLRLSMPLEKEPERYALLCKVQLTEAGKGCNPGKMRNFLAEEVTEDDMATGSCPSRPVALTIPAHTAFPGVTAAKTMGRKYIRNRGYGGGTRTAAQAAVKSVFKQLSQGWKSLTNEQILAWNSLALSQAGRSVLGTSSKITGSNLYMRLNYWIVYCVGDALTAPPTLRGVEAPSGAAISLTADAFTFTLDSEPTENMADLKLVIMASAPQSNGVTRAYSKAVGIGTPKDPVSDEYDLKAEYDTRHGAPSDAAPKVFMKWFFVDTTTGEVSGEQMALAQLTTATEPDAGA